MIPTVLVGLTDARIRLSGGHRLWTSLEGQNPGGSIKDRMVLPEISRLKSQGISKISEVSAGSTALSLAYYSQIHGIQCKLFVPDGVKDEVRLKLLSYGASLASCPFDQIYKDYEAFCVNSDYLRFDQMKRKELRAHYTLWAAKDLQPALPKIDFVISSVGTGHSLIGVKSALQPAAGCLVAEPLFGQTVTGVRNLSAINFGADDPCELRYFENRIEIDSADYFSDNNIESDHGIISVSDSFKLTLGATIKFLNNVTEPTNAFLIGSHCKIT